MCEFKIVIDAKIVFKDVVYLRSDNKVVTAKNVLGETREFKNCAITEVDVNTSRLVLTPQP